MSEWILVTGGTGLIGSRVADFLVREGRSVVLYDVERPGAELEQLKEEFPDRLEIVKGDVCTMGRLGDVVRRNRVTQLIHLAGLLGTECNADAELATNVNVHGTLNVLELARILDLERVLVASTASVYGLEEQYPAEALPLGEDAPLLLAPHSPIYAGTKLYMEKLCEHYRTRFGVRAFGLRPSTVYGHGRRHGGFTWLSDVMSSAATGGTVTLDAGDAKINIVYVDDVAAQFAALLDAPVTVFANRPFFNTGGDTCTLGEVGELLRRLVPDATVTVNPAGTIEHAYDITDAALVEAVGFTREYSPLEKGVRAHVDAARLAHGLPPVAKDEALTAA